MSNDERESLCSRLIDGQQEYQDLSLIANLLEEDQLLNCMLKDLLDIHALLSVHYASGICTDEDQPQ